MNRLWIRLSLAFSAVVFVSIAALALISVAIIRENVAEMERARAEIENGSFEAFRRSFVSGYRVNTGLEP